MMRAPAAVSLVRYGFSVEADRVYRGLLRRGRGRVAAVAADLGMPVAQVGEALAELAYRGAVAPPDAGQPGWRAEPPDRLLALLNDREGQHPARRPAPPGAGAPRFTPRERALISFLTAGHSDAGAARGLGVSPRTVSSMLRVLMDRLGVGNRFQLGVAVGRLTGGPPTHS
ncbi:helix-turn-helix transcriptional regulator [Phytohabitans aurantiacus]|jgi:DNA-binding CsgD family transcriptional regulator|nr:helix-turn-helix transcriptional regulator [Phytohabitans aurantiacus]